MSTQKRGRPNTHLSEAPFALRFSLAMLDQVRAAAKREAITMAAWIRKAIEARLSL